MSSIPAGDATALLERVKRVFGGLDIAREITHKKAIVFVGRAPRAAAAASVKEDLAQRAVDTMLTDDTPTQEEIDALEACIRFMRPALLIQDDRIVFDPRSRRPFGEDRTTAMNQLVSSVAAITPADSRGVIGTGFLVAPRMLATARHVTAEMCGTAVAARFGMEHDRIDSPDAIAITGCISHPDEDVALIEIASEPAGRAALPLSREPTAPVGTAVLVIGFPSAAAGPAYLQVLFDGIYERKRASPGEVLGTSDLELFHDASTLGGSSGSPVVDVSTGHVIGIHTNGAFAYRNTGVLTTAVCGAEELRDLVSRWC